jgi:hypothetical protein
MAAEFGHSRIGDSRRWTLAFAYANVRCRFGELPDMSPGAIAMGLIERAGEGRAGFVQMFGTAQMPQAKAGTLCPASGTVAPSRLSQGTERERLRTLSSSPCTP